MDHYRSPPYHHLFHTSSMAKVQSTVHFSYRELPLSRSTKPNAKWDSASSSSLPSLCSSVYHGNGGALLSSPPCPCNAMAYSMLSQCNHRTMVSSLSGTRLSLGTSIWKHKSNMTLCFVHLVITNGTSMVVVHSSLTHANKASTSIFQHNMVNG